MQNELEKSPVQDFFRMWTMPMNQAAKEEKETQRPGVQGSKGWLKPDPTGPSR